MSAPLTEREILLIDAAAKYGISDAGNKYYKLGGHGFVNVRFHHGTLYRLRDQGLLTRDPGYWKATEAGKLIVENK